MRQRLNVARDLRTMLLYIFQALFQSLRRPARTTIRLHKLHRQQRQPLANVVMQISRDPAALLLLRFNQLTADRSERLLGKFLICRINRRTDEPTKRSIPVHSRRRNIEYPAVGSIASAEAVLP